MPDIPPSQNPPTSDHAPPPHEANGAVNPSVRFEPRDVSARGILTFAAVLVVGLLATAEGLWLLLNHYKSREQAAKPVENPWAAEDRNQWLPYQRWAGAERLPRIDRADQSRLFKLPRLEKLVAEYTVQQQIADEERHLAAVGWIEGEDKVLHIPIEEAMKQMASQLESRPTSKTEQFERSTEEFFRAPSRSSSGQRPRRGEP